MNCLYVSIIISIFAPSNHWNSEHMTFLSNMKTIVEFEMWRNMILMAVCAGCLSACSFEDNAVTPEPTVPERDYSERMVPVVDPKNATRGVVTLRFYKDMPSVPYISISVFQKLIYPGTSVQVDKTGDGQYVLTNPCGTATVDVASDTFESDDYEAFTNLMWQIQTGMPNTIYDALPIIRWKSMEATPKQVHVKLDYGKFGIDLRADEQGVYFPFATIADLYMDGYMHIADFNGQSVMITPDGSNDLDDGYPEFIITPILKETRTADMSQFSYKNLCFTLTNFFGYPGSTLLENKGLKEKGLDQALQDYGKAGQMTRELLLSQNMYDFIAGTATLSCLLDDKGHTFTDVTAFSPMSGNAAFDSKAELYKTKKLEEFVGYCPEYAPVHKIHADKTQRALTLGTLRTEKFGKDVRYVKVGHTAYCQFESFLCDDSGWKKFYKGEGSKPTVNAYPNDWLVTLIDALDQAQKDPEVKNFILDISTNGGGSTDIVLFITSLLCNKSDIYYDNVLTGQKIKCSFEVDRNLDGKFDEKDQEVKYDLNFGLLTSSFSFSCANLLPALLKDYGIAILGERSGGGSCAVLYNPSADGFGYRYSTHRFRMTNSKGEDIDPGIKPHYELANEDYFDIPKLAQLIESYYSK